VFLVGCIAPSSESKGSNENLNYWPTKSDSNCLIKVRLACCQTSGFSDFGQTSARFQPKLKSITARSWEAFDIIWLNAEDDILNPMDAWERLQTISRMMFGIKLSQKCTYPSIQAYITGISNRNITTWLKYPTHSTIHHRTLIVLIFQNHRNYLRWSRDSLNHHIHA
jgi:hypothetical protein